MRAKANSLHAPPAETDSVTVYCLLVEALYRGGELLTLQARGNTEHGGHRAQVTRRCQQTVWASVSGTTQGAFRDQK